MTDTAPRPGMVARRTVAGDLIEWLDVPQRAAALGMEPHPEGGWYVRTWTSPATVSTPAGDRPAATLIHFLLPPGEASAWHRVTSDEIWMWHGPDTVELELGGAGDQPEPGDRITLGPDAGRHRVHDAQAFVRGGVWQRTQLPRTIGRTSCSRVGVARDRSGAPYGMKVLVTPYLRW